MASLTRSLVKLSQGVYTSATRKAAQNCRYVSSHSYARCRSTLTRRMDGGSAINLLCRSPSIINSHCARSIFTSGDKDLADFLKSEIEFEEGNVRKVPTLGNFQPSIDGTDVTLTSSYEGEKIVVNFDINESVNVDDDIDSMAEPKEDDIPAITSYPSFTVSITKPSGNTLHFNCNCNTGINEDEDIHDGHEEQNDFLRFDSVMCYNADLTDVEKAYSAETENMDGELHALLMSMLLERGINGTFVNDLIDLSTIVEQKQYVNFLKSLGKFASER